MNFNPQTYAIPDLPQRPFIDPQEIREMLLAAHPDEAEIRRIVDKSLSLQRLSMQETAALIAADAPGSVSLILDAARELKQRVYGSRMVLFAPLYVGNMCVNNCLYCGFRASNSKSHRVTLSDERLDAEVRALERGGHKRLILVYGEHPVYDARFIADNVRRVYSIKEGNGEIRRVNINAAPMDIEGFRTIKESGIGTYQIFQETYDPDRYRRFHPSGRKADFDYRLTSLDRAMEAGIDDVGLGVLLGLADWRYELLALIRHTNHLEACYGVGPHTISFPRIKNASSIDRTAVEHVSDDDFVRMVAILRLAVPYTGLILTAREEPALRDRLIEYGVSQIDAGTKLEIGGYSEESTLAAARTCCPDNNSPSQDLNREQFELGDPRSLGEITANLISGGHIPSFCTACYRKGRTGEHFMEFSAKGFIKRFCTPNALLTFAEYLEDYASPELREEGLRLIDKELEGLGNDSAELRSRLERIRSGERDLLF